MLAPPPSVPSKRPRRCDERASSDSLATGSSPGKTAHGNSQEIRMTLPSGLSLPTYWWRPEVSPSTSTSSLSTAAILCLHGAGDVGLVWSQVARRLVLDPRLAGSAIVAADLRGHGGALVNEALEESLQMERLVQDVLDLVRAVSTSVGGQGLVLCGHSLGGALAARTAAAALKERPPLPVRAVVLLEAVEGTAAETLPRAAAWLQQRPRSFKCPEEAIAWSLQSGMLSSETAARENVPRRLAHLRAAESESEESWHWITDVSAAASCWTQWFQGLSDIFVALPLPKLLVVGGLDRLDAALEAAHMQGRFRLEVVQHQGHQIHEDRPEEVAEAVAKFLQGLKQQEVAFAKLQARSQPSQGRHSA
eukprot:TRINITY_DN96769_c0_g1_i1.p1 TRINITY_DN96769_c0_g1~~TRINITY_DN96769_c0_g1_i1.p1  ORF type:complete len:364 (-),score=62.78 TRINITY_DN96769_c0_g1_i1:61-1152(-)